MPTPRTPAVLLCSVPVHGHVTPMLSVAEVLAERGMDVRFLTGSRFRERVLATGAEFLPLPSEADFDDRTLDEQFPARTRMIGLEQIKHDVVQLFLRPMAAQMRALEGAIATRRTDVVLAEPGSWAAWALAARPRQSRPAVFALCLLPMPLGSRDTAPMGPGIRPMGGPLGRIRNAVLRVAVRRMFADVQREIAAEFQKLAGRPMPVSFFEASVLADEFLQFTVPEFEYPRSDLPPNVRFVGPVVRPTPSAEADDLPTWWSDLDGRRVVHVTQGTFANVDLSTLIVPTIRALARDDVLVVVTTGGRDTALVESAHGAPLPDNVRVAEYLPYGSLLPRVDVMVTNGGYGGVQLALQHGVPLVSSGRSEDKPEVGARIAWSGAGIDLKAERPDPLAIRAAVRRVLTEPHYARQAQRLGAAMAASGGAAEVARLVTEAAGARPSPAPEATRGRPTRPHRRAPLVVSGP